jgi:CubicO group peptidase (beta-lactamase class C family)
VITAPHDRRSPLLQIHGVVEPGFEKVRDAFAANFGRPPDPFNVLLGVDVSEVGAAVTVFHRGRKVVDLWAGLADRSTGRPYCADTLQLVFSTTKGVTAIAANLLAQRGLIDLDAPVATYWPEFAQLGKADIPVRWLLAHRAGLPWVDESMSLENALDWDLVVDALARQAPAWEPGSRHGYHATTFGWLVGEVVRRVTGMSIGQFVRTELAEPLGLDLWIGLPVTEHHRVAPVEVIEFPTDPGALAVVEQVLGSDTPLGRALYAPGGAWAEHRFTAFNRPDVWSAELPAANAITDARSLAKLYAACVGEVPGADGRPMRLLGDDTVSRAIERQTEGVDLVLMEMDLQYGLGFHLPGTMLKLGGHRSFGHYGAGGSVGFADPDAELGFGYVMNRMVLGLTGDPRTATLIDATYQSLES